MPSVSFWVTTGIDITEIQLPMHLIFIRNKFNLFYVSQCSHILGSACSLSGFMFIIAVLKLLLRLDYYTMVPKKQSVFEKIKCYSQLVLYSCQGISF